MFSKYLRTVGESKGRHGGPNGSPWDPPSPGIDPGTPPHTQPGIWPIFMFWTQISSFGPQWTLPFGGVRGSKKSIFPKNLETGGELKEMSGDLNSISQSFNQSAPRDLTQVTGQRAPKNPFFQRISKSLGNRRTATGDKTEALGLSHHTCAQPEIRRKTHSKPQVLSHNGEFLCRS